MCLGAGLFCYFIRTCTKKNEKNCKDCLRRNLKHG